ncbi:MAG: hypothetical protein AMJ72_09000 [Acidithiobacillales bacterium SM1_46]|jgi:hypothetical protein|nr:MAG: hypothetical protein AMJ72_09000 [Acidithiobacillales bacterium SM1_46]
MELTVKQLSEARDTVESLLEQLGLRSYLFEVEPRGNHWEVRVECAPNSGWQSSVLSVGEGWLDACRIDNRARGKLLDEWRERLTAKPD